MENEVKTYLDEEILKIETEVQELSGKITLSAELLDALTGGKGIRRIKKWPPWNAQWPGFMEFNNLKTSIILYTDGSAELRASFNRRPLSLPDWNPRVHIQFVLYDKDWAGIEVVDVGGLANSCDNFFEVRSQYLARPQEFNRIVYHGVRLVGGRWGRC